MSSKSIVNMPASIKQRLLNLAKSRREDFNFIIGRFATERFLYRLSESDYSKDFVLKGAMLFHLRSDFSCHRTTRDLDLLGKGRADIQRINDIFQSVCKLTVIDDGLIFSAKSVKSAYIKIDDIYQGIRTNMDARLGKARIPLQIDVGFGDTVVPEPAFEELNVLLDLPAPSILVYPWETVIAEKFNAIVELGMDNSRLKDYFDLHYLSNNLSFDGRLLSKAIKDVFRRRNTFLPEDIPSGLLPQFAKDPVKHNQWIAFHRKLGQVMNIPALNVILNELQTFLLPPTDHALQNKDFGKIWPPCGPWQNQSTSTEETE